MCVHVFSCVVHQNPLTEPTHRPSRAVSKFSSEIFFLLKVTSLPPTEMEGLFFSRVVLDLLSPFYFEYTGLSSVLKITLEI